MYSLLCNLAIIFSLLPKLHRAYRQQTFKLKQINIKYTRPFVGFLCTRLYVPVFDGNLYLHIMAYVFPESGFPIRAYQHLYITTTLQAAYSTGNVECGVLHMHPVEFIKPHNCPTKLLMVTNLVRSGIYSVGCQLWRRKLFEAVGL